MFNYFQPKTLLETFRLQVEGNDIQGLGWKKMNYESFSFGVIVAEIQE